MSIVVRNVAASGWRYARHGPASKVLQFEKFRIPFDRKSNQVVVKMLAAPVHKNDKNMIEGCYGPIRPRGFPAVAGIEGCGIVEEKGTAVSLGINEGDLVWINNQRVGTWATHIVTEADNLDVIPNRADIDIEHLASLTIYHTAHHLINSFVKLEPGDVVLQAGAASAVAQLCMAYARARGAKIFLTMKYGRTEHHQILGRCKLNGAFAVVPYNYVRTNYMQRLLSDIPPPKLFLNGISGPYCWPLVRLLGNEGTVVTYGSASGLPLQLPNIELISRNISFKGFFFPRWVERHTREQRMRVHQTVVDQMALDQGHALFYAQRYKMDTDSIFAFSNAWDMPYVSRKAVLRMVGEYGEWRRARTELFHYQIGRAVWEDCIHQNWESAGCSDNPQTMKYYTPFDDWNSVFQDAQQSRELGHREVFFRRPNAPRHNTETEQSV